jgi:pSer/pThr/pTyr-binding forkhead associated (FHA) protein
MDKTQVIVSDVYVVDQLTKEETRIFGDMTFGRVEVDKNFPKDTLISRKHFRLRPTSEGVLIEDLGSTNRTKVNGKLLKANTLYKLKSRDTIEFGQQKVQIFIGGKIVGDAATLVSKDAANVDAVEQSMVFERLVSDKQTGDGRMKEIQSNSEMVFNKGIEVDSDQDKGIASKKDDAIIQSLVQKKNTAWYLQFAGSEFGPLSLKELKVVVTSKQFQGGVLYAFTEGLADWLPVEKIQKFLDAPLPEFTATQRIGSGVTLTATVHCFLNSKNQEAKLTGSCENIGLSEITVSLKGAFQPNNLFEIEVLPVPSSGIGNFRATVKLDRTRENGNSHTFLFIQAAPGTKMEIERYLRSKG